jgi:hypothetical protein
MARYQRECAEATCLTETPLHEDTRRYRCVQRASKLSLFILGAMKVTVD